MAVSNPWSKDNPVFLYANNQAIDDLMLEIYEEMSKSSTITNLDIAGADCLPKKNYNSLLALIGLPDGDINIGFSIELAEDILADISVEDKLNTLVDFYTVNNNFPFIDSHNGLELTREENKHVKEWHGKKIEPRPGYFFGELLENYMARRIYPAPLTNEPEDENEEYGLLLAGEFMNEPDYLWELETIAGSKLKAIVSLDSYNMRTKPDPS